MNMVAHATLRESFYLWIFRFAQCLVSLTVLAIALASVKDWDEMGCVMPSQLQVNIAAVRLSYSSH